MVNEDLKANTDRSRCSLIPGLQENLKRLVETAAFLQTQDDMSSFPPGADLSLFVSFEMFQMKSQSAFYRLKTNSVCSSPSSRSWKMEAADKCAEVKLAPEQNNMAISVPCSLFRALH